METSVAFRSAKAPLFRGAKGDKRKNHTVTGKLTVRTLLKRVWSEDQGVLTFEWVLLITLVILGIVGGLSAARDAIIDELGDVGGAIIAVDQSWTFQVSPCDPCKFDFGHFTDDQPKVCRGRPAAPPISQTP